MLCIFCHKQKKCIKNEMIGSWMRKIEATCSFKKLGDNMENYLPKICNS